MVHNKNRLVLVSDFQANTTLCLKPIDLDPYVYPKVLVSFEINNITVNLNNYLYTVMNYIVDIMK